MFRPTSVFSDTTTNVLTAGHGRIELHTPYLQWVSPPVYPHATKQFCELFEEDDSQYDGVYAMLVSAVLQCAVKECPSESHRPRSPYTSICVFAFLFFTIVFVSSMSSRCV